MTFVNRPIKPSVFLPWILKPCYNFAANRRKYRYMTWIIYPLCLLISLSTWKWLLHVIAVHSCKSLPGESKQTNHFLRMKPNVFFPFSKATTRLGKSMSAHQAEACLLANSFYTQNLFACRAMWRTFEILTSFGHWVKNPKGGDGAAC